MEHVTIKFSEEELKRLETIIKDNVHNYSEAYDELLKKVQSGIRGIERIEASRL